MSDWFNWGDVKESSTEALIAQRTNLARYIHVSLVRTRLMAIQEELDARAEQPMRAPDTPSDAR